MVLVDTSIWIDYLRKGGVPGFSELLLQDQVVLSFWVRLELLSGTRRSKERLDLEKNLHGVRGLQFEPLKEDVLGFCKTKGLGGRGLSGIDITLLAEASLNHLPIWTTDKPLRKTARELGMEYQGN